MDEDGITMEGKIGCELECLSAGGVEGGIGVFGSSFGG